MKLFRLTLPIVMFMGLAACETVDAPQQPPVIAQEQAEDGAETLPTFDPRDNPLFGRAMATAANPLAVDAAVAILKDGGHAVDAAIAAHAVLGLVEPQSSGLGGGGFMLVFDATTRTITTYDGRETAPAAISETLFLKENGEAMGFLDAWQSGKSVGVPGIVALYADAHEDFGKAEWATLFDEAQRLAREGFVVSPRLNELLSSDRLRGAVRLDDRPDSANYFYPKDTPLQIGDVRDNPAYADLLARIATEGPSAFYKGEIPAAIVRAAKRYESAGAITVEDIEGYEAIKRETLCGSFKSYKVCSSAPPGSGAIALAETLGLYERMDVNARKDPEAALRAFVDAQRLAYADRDHYVADADQVFVPIKELMSSEYLDARIEDRFAPKEKSYPGDPGAVVNGEPIVDMWGRDPTEHAPGTTHLSIVDRHGNAVSLTATVEAPFGSSRWVPEGGFLLNNELTDFARAPFKNGKIVANAPASGKRPRSSMSPTIVLDGETDKLVMVTGSPGGNSIIAYTAKSLLGVLDWELTAQQAADLPNIIARGDSVNVEIGVPGGKLAAERLNKAGYAVREREGENSGIHSIIVRPDRYEGAADKRREGKVVSIVPKAN